MESLGKYVLSTAGKDKSGPTADLYFFWYNGVYKISNSVLDDEKGNPSPFVEVKAHNIRMTKGNEKMHRKNKDTKFKITKLVGYQLPEASDAKFMVTGQLSGCSFVLHKTTDNRIIAAHIEPRSHTGTKKSTINVSVDDIETVRGEDYVLNRTGLEECIKDHGKFTSVTDENGTDVEPIKKTEGFAVWGPTQYWPGRGNRSTILGLLREDGWHFYAQVYQGKDIARISHLEFLDSSNPAQLLVVLQSKTENKKEPDIIEEEPPVVKKKSTKKKKVVSTDKSISSTKSKSTKVGKGKN
mmetsp:Transcript_31998/g.52852  ORF Transcript_31998/g.52852 Transcript_31998/m.52852 type:complete len:297 (-) Transcript_31998:120-1010(-)|eukprot:CAMPEP_0119014564 /NCGR_PEP_ID=MMETSP1176-20130426/9960_1 /TAXON_ID=265551 /ORGANISM="Synedropsis recta cf, Strain CCMP1620" /LENGTH=296 /DNA_ID=CAMNT_0006967765 /DNA_START=148 /DNA_END=1038 /DNA_ORIENTATION=+